MTECKHCDDSAWAKGLCRFHYRRQRDGVPFDAPRRRRERHPGCTICGDTHFAKGLCAFHYNRQRRGIPLQLPKGRRNGLAPYFDWAACGTPAQARKHYRYNIPMCGPCRKAERRYGKDRRAA